MKILKINKKAESFDSNMFHIAVKLTIFCERLPKDYSIAHAEKIVIPYSIDKDERDWGIKDINFSTSGVQKMIPFSIEFADDSILPVNKKVLVDLGNIKISVNRFPNSTSMMMTALDLSLIAPADPETGQFQVDYSKSVLEAQR
jgi:hypothetical protein